MGCNISIQKRSIKNFSQYDRDSGVCTIDLQSLLKDTELIAQLLRKGYVFFDARVHKLREPSLEVLEEFYAFLQRLEYIKELYIPGNAFPYEITLYPSKQNRDIVRISKSDIELFVRMEGYSIKYEVSLAYWNVVYCNLSFVGKLEKSYLLRKYGKSSHIPETKNDMHGPSGNYVIIPIGDIDKLIAVERFRELDDSDQTPIYTGKESIYELDLRSPEESTYKYFLERRIIVEYDIKDISTKYLYPPRDEGKTEKLSPKERYLLSWLRFLCKKISKLFIVEDQNLNSRHS